VIPKESGNDEGTLEVLESSTRGNPGLRARGTPGPCGVNRGGCSPMCRAPCCSHLYRAVQTSAHVISTTMVAERFAPLTRILGTKGGRRQALGPVIWSAFTHSSNCSSVSISSSSALCLNVRPFSCAFLAILAELS